MHSLPGIKNSVVLYTGAGGLIGSAACIELAKQGAKLALLDPNIESLKKISDAIRNIDPELPHSIHGNTNTLNSDSIDQCLAEIESKLGPIDCLISSAYPRTADWHLKFEKIPMESWQKNVDDHLNSYFLMGQRCAVKMMLRGKGNIIFFSSIYGLSGPRFDVYDGLSDMTMPAGYAAIKGGISNLTKYMASYLGPSGIRVNAICPGGVQDSQNVSFIKSYCKQVPLRRMANLDDICGPLLFLVSDYSNYMSGVNLPVDGGWLAT